MEASLRDSSDPRDAAHKGAAGMFDIRPALASRILVHRNNVALARPMRGQSLGPPTRYGLGVGSPDLVGCVPVHALIVPAGTPGAVLLGRYAGFESKIGSGRPTADQRAWHDVARRFGAFVAVVRSEADAVEALERCRRGEHE